MKHHYNCNKIWLNHFMKNRLLSNVLSSNIFNVNIGYFFGWRQKQTYSCIKDGQMENSIISAFSPSQKIKVDGALKRDNTVIRKCACNSKIQWQPICHFLPEQHKNVHGFVHSILWSQLRYKQYTVCPFSPSKATLHTCSVQTFSFWDGTIKNYTILETYFFTDFRDLCL